MIRDYETLLTHLETLEQGIRAFSMASDSEEGLKPEDVKNLQFQFQTLEPIVNWSAIEQEVEEKQEQRQLEAKAQLAQDKRDYRQMTAGSLTKSNGNLYF